MEMNNLLQCLNQISLISGALENLFFGIDASDCSLPCETFSTETKLTSTINSDYTGFSLTYKETVECLGGRIPHALLPSPSKGNAGS